MCSIVGDFMVNFIAIARTALSHNLVSIGFERKLCNFLVGLVLASSLWSWNRYVFFLISYSRI
jgi:hypothetical protein